MTIGPMPKWWKEAEPYFIYTMDERNISEDAPEELKKKYKEWKKNLENNK